MTMVKGDKYVASNNGMELYRKHRPRKLEQVVGQPEAVRSLSAMISRKAVPHVLLMSGPSGTGKTTLARIVARELGCGKRDLSEINCADFRGIDTVRDIRQRMQLAPLSGSCRVWIIDEAAKLSNDAQNAFLKILEDTPGHAYFMLATTDPAKLLETVRTRCTEIKLGPVPNAGLATLIGSVLAAEGRDSLPPDLLGKLVDAAAGSARKALVLLHQVIGLDSDKERLAVLEKADAAKNAFDIVRGLLWRKMSWADMAAIIATVEDDFDGFRRLILANAAKELLKADPRSSGRAADVISVFRDHWFDCGKAGLAVCCYEILHRK